MFLQACVCSTFVGRGTTILPDREEGGATLDWMGVPPPPPPPLEDRAAERALAMRWAVCLLHSRRRTFLLQGTFS